MGIRPKLTLLVVGLLVPLLGATGLVVVALMERVLLDEMEHRGLAMLSALSVPCSVSLAGHEIERLDDLLAQFRPTAGTPDGQPEEARSARDPIRDLIYACVVDPSGRVLAHTEETSYGSVRSDPFARAARESKQALFERIERPDGRHALAVAVPVESGLRWGTLLAEFSLKRLEQRTGRMRWNVLGITLALMVLTVVALTTGLSRLVIRPVRALSTMAERLGEGDLDHRVEERSSRDELGTLARVFNSTAEELAAYTRDLEQKVRQRSREIVDKNQDLELANRSLSDANKRLEEVATTDGLTGLANKSHLLSRLEFEVMRAQRGGHKLSLMMMDVDHFKHYNDTHGHLAGDRLLAGLARLIKDNLRSIDIVGRFGGEEFCVALLDTGKRPAVKVAEKIRRAVERESFEGQDRQPDGNLTISIGVAELDRENDSMNDLIERADAALYEAKRAGRNRVEGT